MGSLAAVSLLAVYFVVLALANSLDHATEELLRLWYWMLPLIAGFALQIGLFTYGRRAATMPSTLVMKIEKLGGTKLREFRWP
jgi:hypothetical protein